MDQHPIPQDVTGFQFKLIGTMTVKQFGYVASGVILAVVLYYLPLKGFFYIMMKVVLIPLLGGSGVFVAFVPIEGRPVDVMATNFFKAVFSPNQYVYHKVGRRFSFSTLDLAPVVAHTEAVVNSTTASVRQKEIDKKGAQLQAFLKSNRNEIKNPLDQRELTMLSSLALPAAPKPVPAAQADPSTAAHPAAHAAVKHAVPAAKPISHPLPASAHPQPGAQIPPTVHATPPQEQTLIKQETVLQQQLQAAKQEETSSHAPAAHQKVMTLQKQLEELHAQKQRLESEIVSLKTQLAPAAQPVQQMQQAAVHAPAAPSLQPAAPVNPAPLPSPALAAPAVQPPPAIPASQYAKTLAQPAAKSADLPKVSDTPNVVVGIVKDPRGNILPNMLVEVKDRDGSPVRAFKTNALGQFASATPLTKGIYTIELDDPKKQHTFDSIQITANNQVMLPIEIISHDAREELRKQLFN